MDSFCSEKLQEGNFAAKLEAAAPYNFFLTTIEAEEATHNEPLSIRFTDLLDKSLGELESSMQINFVVDLEWLMAQYDTSGYGGTPLLIVYGAQDAELEKINELDGNVKTIHVKGTGQYGIQHTKMCLFAYTDGSMRVVISTANLYQEDWGKFTNGVWISPKLPKTTSGNDGESTTGFRKDLLQYLNSYNLLDLQMWKDRINETDFSGVNVFLVASVPGEYNCLRGLQYGHPRLRSLLSKYVLAKNEDAIIAQSSSIGNLGPSRIKSWGGAEFFRSASKCLVQKPSNRRLPQREPFFKIIYPSLANVLACHDGLVGAGGLGYKSTMHRSQKWVSDIFHKWHSDSRNRTRAMPHIKTYCRVSGPLENPRGLHWFLLTSANLSKGAWGACWYIADKPKHQRTMAIHNYEAGVLFLPKFVLGADLLPLDSNQDKPLLQLPYDLPLIPYNSDDSPFFSNLQYEEESCDE